MKASYAYQNQNFSMQRGEVLHLREKSNQDWWLVENTEGVEGFAPATYLKEIGSLMFTRKQQRLVRKPEVVQVQKVVRKPLASLQKPKKANISLLRRKTTSIQPRQLQHLNTENLQQRQVDLSFAFDQLMNASLEKRKQLERTISFYKWLRKYDELWRWIKEKQLQINRENSLLEDPDSAKRVYQAFTTDYLANEAEFPFLDKLAEELSSRKYIYAQNSTEKMTSEQIKAKQAELNRELEKLVDLKKYWDQSIKALHSIDQFNMLCAEVNDLLAEKQHSLSSGQLNDDVIDVKSVRALQSKQDKLERELGPIAKNILDLEKCARDVCTYFPQERANVERKLQSVNVQHAHLKDAVKARKQQLDERHGLQRFENEVHDFTAACERLQLLVADLSSPRDLKECDDMQKRLHEAEQEFKDQITYNHASLLQLGKQLSNKHGVTSVDRINALLGHVSSLKNELGVAILATQQHLTDSAKVLKFKQDANKLDLLMHDQEAYLQYEDVGCSAANVEALQTRHEDFIAKLNAQDEKMKQLAEQLSKMEGIDSIDLNDLADTYEMLSEKRQKLKLSALERKLLLKQSKDFYEFKIKCDDLEAWCNERRVLVQTTVAIDQGEATPLYQIEKKLNKQEAIESELAANRTRLERLMQDADDLIQSQLNCRKMNAKVAVDPDDIRSLVAMVDQNWADLERETIANGKKLYLAKHRANLNMSLNDIDSRMHNVEQEVETVHNTSDLRSVKEALKKHADLKKQVAVELDLINEAAKTNPAVRECLQKFASITPKLESKQRELEQQLNIQELLFNIDEELTWTNQCIVQIDMLTRHLPPQTLSEIVNINKKFAELDRVILITHKPNIERLLSQASGFLSTDSKELVDKASFLSKELNALCDLFEKRKSQLTLCTRELEELENLNQISAGLAEKLPIIHNASAITTDENSLNKHLVSCTL